MPKLKLTAETIQPYLDNIKDWGLIVPDWFWDLTPEEIAECYNGVGSDLTPKYIRWGLSFAYNFAIEEIIVHDVIFSMIKRFALTVKDFYEANKNLKINARICLKYKKELYTQSYSAWCYTKAWIAGKMCNWFGLKAWNTDNEEKEEK